MASLSWTLILDTSADVGAIIARDVGGCESFHELVQLEAATETR